MSPKFPSAIPVVGRFSYELLRALKAYQAESHFLPNIHDEATPAKTTNGPKTLAVSVKKVPSHALGWIPNTPPIGKVLEMCGVCEMKMNVICSHKVVHRKVVETE